MNRLKERYIKDILPKLIAEGSKNIYAAPRIEKVVINMGVGLATQNPKELDDAIEDMITITGQKPVKTLAKKSIAAFKVRTGQEIGCKVTLRGDRMYEFLDKLFNVVLPRVRDFRGVSKKSFDGRGNYTLGIREQSIFPEIDTSKMTKSRSFEITILTTATTSDRTMSLLTHLGLPLEKS